MPTSRAAVKQIELKPNPGPQFEFLSTEADWAFYGGQVGGGKSFALLLEPVRHVHTPRFGAVIFRGHLNDVTKQGGLWDEALSIYPDQGAIPRQTPQREFVWKSPRGENLGNVQFAHLESYEEAMNWKSAQITMLGFDQVEEIGAPEFWYMTSRNRTRCSVAPYLRATCNPDPDCFLVSDGSNWGRGLISWWIGDDGLAIEERSGVIRWFQRINDELHFAGSRQEMAEKAVRMGAKPMPISLTFIHARLEDNPMMPHRDRYEATLMSLPRVDQQRLLHGNWLVRPAAGDIFDRAWFEIVDASPVEGMSCRGWDNASTPGGGDWSCGIKWKRHVSGVYYVEDVVRGQWSSMDRDRVQRQVAEADGISVEIAIAQDPGSAGRDVVDATIRNLDGFVVRPEPTTGMKHLRWMPMSSQAQAGNIKLVRGDWNEAFLREFHNASAERSTRKRKDDQLDASASAFNRLAERGAVSFEGAMMRY